MLTQFDSDEALLLMYLAGELSPQDQSLVQRRLEQNADLRAQLESLRAAILDVERHLPDAGKVDDITVERVTRKATAAMRSRGLASRRTLDNAPEAQRWRLPGWAYPAAAAAILLVAVSVYLANMQPPKEVAVAPRPPVYAPDLTEQFIPEPAELEPVLAAVTADELAAAFDDGEWVMADALNGEGLAGALAELGEIQRLAGDADGADVLNAGGAEGAGVVQ